MKQFLSLLLFICFFASIKASTFTSNVAAGNWSSASSWVITVPTGTNTTPTGIDDVIILNGHTIKLIATANCKSLDINVGGILNGNTRQLKIKGNFTNSGSVIGNLELFIQANCLFTSVPTYTNTGNTWIQNFSTLTFAVGTTVNKKGPIIMQTTGTKVVNNGTVTIKNNGAVLGNIKFSSSNNIWTNLSGSSLTVQGNMVVSVPASASLVCTAVPNTVAYTTTCTALFSGVQPTYNNLTLTSNTAKTLSGDLNVTGNLTMSGATNSLATNGNDINLGGNLVTNTSKLIFTSGDKITFDGAASTQTISGTNNCLFYNLEINNVGGGVVFTNSMTVTNDLIMVAGDCNSNDKLILQSTIGNSARIAPVPSSGCSFSGNMIIQKFIDTMPYNYYDLSSPCQSAVVNDWDDEIYISAIGTYDGIGGPAGVDGIVLNLDSSMHTYDEVSNTFKGVTGSNTPLVPGTGYNLILADNATSWFSKTIDTRGVPNFGDLLLEDNDPVNGLTWNDLGTGGGWHLVGNPYASHIDYTFMDANSNQGMTSNVYYTDGGNYTLWPFSTIPPFQGFYVETNQNSFYHSITFTESCKTTDHTTDFHRKKANYDIKLTINSQLTPYSHENTICFNSLATVNYDDKYDATYRKFPIAIAPAIYMIDRKIKRNLIKNVINSEEEELTIPISIFTPKAGVYYVDASVLNTDAYNYVWLENIKTGVSYDLNNSVAIEGAELGTNTDFVLRLSKLKKSGSVSETILETDLVIFNTENTINFKSTTTNHSLSEVMVYDMTGKLVLSQSNVNVVPGDITKVDVSSLTTGIYVVSATDEQGRKTTKKLIK